MYYKISVFIFVSCFFVLGCTSEPEQMKIAERIFETYPDSAISILKHLKPEIDKSNSTRALYGLLFFEYTERIDKKLLDPSIIDFSINYYVRKNDQHHLAKCYYSKGHMLLHSQHFDESILLDLKAIDCLQDINDFDLSGKIYSDMGLIFTIQKNYKEALIKFQSSLSYFNKAGEKNDAGFETIYIGRLYNNLKKNELARWYFRKAISNTNDSLLYGVFYQSLGISYYLSKQYDSAQYYLRKSLIYPYKWNNYSIRCCFLSDLLFDLNQYDSSFVYATRTLKYPATYYTQRDCYRILSNLEYNRKKFKKASVYIGYYQDYNDSIRKVEAQPKGVFLEKLHNTTNEAHSTKRNMILIVSVLIFILILSSGLVFFLYKRNRHKRELLEVYKIQLNKKQEFVTQKLSQKIEEARTLQTDIRKNATADERVKLDIELYNNALYLNNWDDFNREMNHAFNNIVSVLNAEFPTITRKEIIWCCLHLLDIPHTDRMLLLEASSDSLYKLKQRLAQKLNLESTKELDPFLKTMIEIKN
jgi:tetratricopeptide (TPR) repeat protein